MHETILIPICIFQLETFFKTGPFAGLPSNETGRSLTDSTWYQHPYGAFQVHATPIWNRIRSGCLMATSNRESTSEYTIHRQRNALHWSLVKFNSYLYGHRLTPVTDHKPVLSIFNPKKVYFQISLNRLV